MAQWAMYAGIGAIVLFLLGFFVPVVGFLGLLAGIAALILGIMANNKAKTMGGLGKGQALTGIVCGAIVIGLFLISLIFVGAVLSGL